MTCRIEAGYTDFKIPVWMPGYYQLMDYPENIEQFTASVYTTTDSLRWERADRQTWRVYANAPGTVLLQYKVKATRQFVASAFLNGKQAFLAPTALYLYRQDHLQDPVAVQIDVPKGWQAATGLDSLPDGTLTAGDFDQLYDSPVLLGQLESFPAFFVRGVPHYFLAIDPGNFDRGALMSDLQGIVEAAVEMMGDIPYKKYVFLGIGPGMGGIEHMNSTAVSFSGDGYEKPAVRNRMLGFLAHEYFHHFNVKRIRPVELGPFDYGKGSRTSQLWISEGITVYYNEILLRRAGLISADDLLESFAGMLRNYENGTGKLFQSVAQASFDTWSDGPFGRTGDLINKTISYYEKGPLLAWMLDLKIRHATNNKKSLDDLMRRLYQEYYKGKHRGFTDTEFRQAAEQIAGVPLDEFFGYVYTVAPLNYNRYLGYSALAVDTAAVVVPGAWTGMKAQFRRDSVRVTQVAWESPAWQAGILPGTVILQVNGTTATANTMDSIRTSGRAGDIIRLETFREGKAGQRALIAGSEMKISWKVTKLKHPGALQQKIWNSWVAEDSFRAGR
ncbi:putative aminopeptidase [Flavihumibacter petaseus NBRC 106054]|uniref:Putative aminopeptidase n=2 Tax=Flavihumibacter TaxID=1004301 RepID=A0A0E9MW72_9BACT|nr:putative aminopeptidase [Flavihumibacter petaseus NBRC 106054]